MKVLCLCIVMSNEVGKTILTASQPGVQILMEPLSECAGNVRWFMFTAIILIDCQ